MKRVALSGTKEKILSVVFLVFFIALFVLLFGLFYGQRRWMILLGIVGALGTVVLVLYLVTIFTSWVDVPKVEHASQRPESLKINGVPRYEVNLRGAAKITVRTFTESRHSPKSIVFLDSQDFEIGAIITDFTGSGEKRIVDAALAISEQLGLPFEANVPRPELDKDDEGHARKSR